MVRLLAIALAAILAASVTAAAAAAQITVFAAASMKDALDKAAADYRSEKGVKVVLSFASSSTLARQIANGAPADAFVSADLQWMDYLARRKAIKPATRRLIAGNDLIIAAQPGASPVADPATILTAGKFAMGDPRNVPAGIYAKAALEHLKLWDKVKSHAVFGENVRVALRYVARGETKAAIVYGSDRLAAPTLAKVYAFPADSHKPIVYPAAETANGKAAALGFLDWLSGPEGQKALAEYGFAPAPGKR